MSPPCYVIIPQAVDFSDVMSGFRHENRTHFRKPDDVQYIIFEFKIKRIIRLQAIVATRSRLNYSFAFELIGCPNLLFHQQYLRRQVYLYAERKTLSQMDIGRGDQSMFRLDKP